MPAGFASIPSRLKRLFQTRTGATDPRRVAALRAAGTQTAWRRCIGLLLAVQGVLWASLTGFDAAGRTLWEAALALTAAGIAVWQISRKVWGGESSSRPWEWLALLPCFMLDAIWVLHALLSLQGQLMPSYPIGILRVWLPLVLTAGVLLGRRSGAAYGISLWRWLVPLAAVWVLLHGIKNHGMEQLFPLLGRGWLSTAGAAAAGLGGLWCIGLLFLVPGEEANMPSGIKPPAVWPYVLLPLCLTCLLALALCCAPPWQAAQGIRLGLRLLWSGRAAGSAFLSGLWALCLLTALMAAFCILLACAARLTERIFPRLPACIPILLTALTATLCLWLPAEPLEALAAALLPWRLMLWAAAALGTAVRRSRMKRRAK